MHSNQFITTTRELAVYSRRTCSNSGAIHLAIIKPADPTFNLLTLDPTLEGPDKKAIANIILAKKEYDIYVKRKATYLNNKTKMYAIIYVQCSEAMRAKLEGEDDFKEAAMESDVIKLLNIIKKHHFNINHRDILTV
eukprot:8703132-Ditylum_brightwellii.AAC.1